MTGEINISTGIETSVNQIFQEIKHITQANAPEKHGPPMPGEQLRSVLSFDKAKKVLGWAPSISFSEGLQNTVAFFQKND